MKSLEQLRVYIYSFLDVEVEDIPQDLLTTWASEGYEKIVRVGRRHPHFEASWDLTAEGLSTPLPDDLATIELLTIEDFQATPISLMDAQRRFPGGSTGGVSQPMFFTQRGKELLLWPAPTAATAVRIFGWRHPADWTATASGVPDLPDHMEGALLSFMLYRAYGHQGMIEDAQVERAEFDSQVREMIAFDNETPAAQPLILGGGSRVHGSRYSGPQPLIFPASGGV